MVNLTVCVCVRGSVSVSVCLSVCSSCNCSTAAMQRKLTASVGLLSDFDSWICKLFCSLEFNMATYSEAVPVSSESCGVSSVRTNFLEFSGVGGGVQRVLQHPPLASNSAPQVPFTN